MIQPRNTTHTAKARFYAIIAIICVSLWVLSGVFFKDAEENTEVAQATESLQNPIEVALFKASLKQRYAEIYGVTEPSRDVNVAAQTRGEVRQILSKEGAYVKKGQPLIRIDMQDRNMQLKAAQLLLEQREKELKGSELLRKKGFENEVQNARAKASLQEVKARIAQLKLDIGFTTIRAPFDGVLEEVNVEQGDFVGIGVFGVEGAIARVTDLNPLLAVGEVSQSDRMLVDMSQPALVEISPKRILEGKITYLAKVATKESRSFPFEVSLGNENADIAAGISATIRIPLQQELAHFIPASVLSLSDEGGIRVKALSDKNEVVAYTVTITEESDGGLWVLGLPENVRLVTSGQAYVSEGDVIDTDAIISKTNTPQEAAL